MFHQGNQWRITQTHNFFLYVYNEHVATFDCVMALLYQCWVIRVIPYPDVSFRPPDKIDHRKRCFFFLLMAMDQTFDQYFSKKYQRSIMVSIFSPVRTVIST